MEGYELVAGKQNYRNTITFEPGVYGEAILWYNTISREGERQAGMMVVVLLVGRLRLGSCTNSTPPGNLAVSQKVSVRCGQSLFR